MIEPQSPPGAGCHDEHLALYEVIKPCLINNQPSRHKLMRYWPDHHLAGPVPDINIVLNTATDVIRIIELREIVLCVGNRPHLLADPGICHYP